MMGKLHSPIKGSRFQSTLLDVGKFSPTKKSMFTENREEDKKVDEEKELEKAKKLNENGGLELVEDVQTTVKNCGRIQFAGVVIPPNAPKDLICEECEKQYAVYYCTHCIECFCAQCAALCHPRVSVSETIHDHEKLGFIRAVQYGDKSRVKREAKFYLPDNEFNVDDYAKLKDVSKPDSLKFHTTDNELNTTAKTDNTNNQLTVLGLQTRAQKQQQLEEKRKKLLEQQPVLQIIPEQHRTLLSDSSATTTTSGSTTTDSSSGTTKDKTPIAIQIAKAAGIDIEELNVKGRVKYQVNDMVLFQDPITSQRAYGRIVSEWDTRHGSVTPAIIRGDESRVYYVVQSLGLLVNVDDMNALVPTNKNPTAAVATETSTILDAQSLTTASSVANTSMVSKNHGEERLLSSVEFTAEKSNFHDIRKLNMKIQEMQNILILGPKYHLRNLQTVKYNNNNSNSNNKGKQMKTNKKNKKEHQRRTSMDSTASSSVMSVMSQQSSSDSTSTSTNVSKVNALTNKTLLRLVKKDMIGGEGGAIGLTIAHNIHGDANNNANKLSMIREEEQNQYVQKLNQQYIQQHNKRGSSSTAAAVDWKRNINPEIYNTVDMSLYVTANKHIDQDTATATVTNYNDYRPYPATLRSYQDVFHSSQDQAHHDKQHHQQQQQQDVEGDSDVTDSDDDDDDDQEDHKQLATAITPLPETPLNQHSIHILPEIALDSLIEYINQMKAKKTHLMTNFVEFQDFLYYRTQVKLAFHFWKSNLEALKLKQYHFYATKIQTCARVWLCRNKISECQEYWANYYEQKRLQLFQKFRFHTSPEVFAPNRAWTYDQTKYFPTMADLNRYAFTLRVNMMKVIKQLTKKRMLLMKKVMIIWKNAIYDFVESSLQNHHIQQELIAYDTSLYSSMYPNYLPPPLQEQQQQEEEETKKQIVFTNLIGSTLHIEHLKSQIESQYIASLPFLYDNLTVQQFAPHDAIRAVDSNPLPPGQPLVNIPVKERIGWYEDYSYQNIGMLPLRMKALYQYYHTREMKKQALITLQEGKKAVIENMMHSHVTDEKNLEGNSIVNQNFNINKVTILNTNNNDGSNITSNNIMEATAETTVKEESLPLILQQVIQQSHSTNSMPTYLPHEDAKDTNTRLPKLPLFSIPKTFKDRLHYTIQATCQTEEYIMNKHHLQGPTAESYWLIPNVLLVGNIPFGPAVKSHFETFTIHPHIAPIMNALIEQWSDANKKQISTEFDEVEEGEESIDDDEDKIGEKQKAINKARKVDDNEEDNNEDEQTNAESSTLYGLESEDDRTIDSHQHHHQHNPTNPSKDHKKTSLSSPTPASSAVAAAFDNNATTKKLSNQTTKKAEIFSTRIEDLSAIACLLLNGINIFLSVLSEEDELAVQSSYYTSQQQIAQEETKDSIEILLQSALQTTKRITTKIIQEQKAFIVKQELLLNKIPRFGKTDPRYAKAYREQLRCQGRIDMHIHTIATVTKQIAMLPEKVYWYRLPIAQCPLPWQEAHILPSLWMLESLIFHTLPGATVGSSTGNNNSNSRGVKQAPKNRIYVYSGSKLHAKEDGHSKDGLAGMLACMVMGRLYSLPPTTALFQWQQSHDCMPLLQQNQHVLTQVTPAVKGNRLTASSSSLSLNKKLPPMPQIRGTDGNIASESSNTTNVAVADTNKRTSIMIVATNKQSKTLTTADNPFMSMGASTPSIKKYINVPPYLWQRTLITQIIEKTHLSIDYPTIRSQLHPDVYHTLHRDHYDRSLVNQCAIPIEEMHPIHMAKKQHLLQLQQPSIVEGEEGYEAQQKAIKAKANGNDNSGNGGGGGMSAAKIHELLSHQMEEDDEQDQSKGQNEEEEEKQAEQQSTLLGLSYEFLEAERQERILASAQALLKASITFANDEDDEDEYDEGKDDMSHLDTFRSGGGGSIISKGSTRSIQKSEKHHQQRRRSKS